MAPPQASLSRFIAPYYGLNVLVVLAYLVIRQFFWSPELDAREGFLGIPREHEIFLLVGVMFAMNYRKKATLDGVIVMLLMYAKVGVLAALYYMDRRVFGWMLVYCAILFVAVGQPKYAGPDSMVPLNPASFEQQIKRSGGSGMRKKKNVSWLVYFYVDWSDNCLQHDAMMAELSLQFSSDTLKFGKVDMFKYPELAKEYQIETSATSSQLPSLILFQGGEEVRRLPYIKEDGTAAKVILDKLGVIGVFRLQDLFEGKKNAFAPKSK